MLLHILPCPVINQSSVAFCAPYSIVMVLFVRHCSVVMCVLFEALLCCDVCCLRHCSVVMCVEALLCCNVCCLRHCSVVMCVCCL